ncbi:MAG: hypothetical protein AAF402_15865 [Pseudomonadota bacterium]
MKKTNQNSSEGGTDKNEFPRRKLLGVLSTGAAATAIVPTKWASPVVDSVMLPAHATTTGSGGDGGDGSDEVEDLIFSGTTVEDENLGAVMPNLIDLVAQPAHAGFRTDRFISMYARLQSSGTVQFQMTYQRFEDCLFSLSTSSTGGIVFFNANGGTANGNFSLCGENEVFDVEYMIAPNNAFIKAYVVLFDKLEFELTLNPGGSPLSAPPCIACPDPSDDMFLQL